MLNRQLKTPIAISTNWSFNTVTTVCFNSVWKWLDTSAKTVFTIDKKNFGKLLRQHFLKPAENLGDALILKIHRADLKIYVAILTFLGTTMTTHGHITVRGRPLSPTSWITGCEHYFLALLPSNPWQWHHGSELRLSKDINDWLDKGCFFTRYFV